MKRTFFGVLFALCVGFVSGCGGGGSTQTTVVEPDAGQQMTEQEEEDYEAQMESGYGGDEG